MADETIQDDQSVSIGLALTGTNTNDLTIASAEWSINVGSLDVAADTLTATYTGVSGETGVFTIDVTATLSDGST